MVSPYSSEMTICKTHQLVNNLFCYNDNRPICTNCVPLHLDHNITYISNIKSGDSYKGALPISPPPSTNPTYSSPSSRIAPIGRNSPNTKSPRIAPLDFEQRVAPTKLIEEPLGPPSRFTDFKPQQYSSPATRLTDNSLPPRSPRLLPYYQNPIPLTSLPIDRNISPRNSHDIITNSQIYDQGNVIKRPMNPSYPGPSPSSSIIVDNPKYYEPAPITKTIPKSPTPLYQAPIQEAPRYAPRDLYIIFKLDSDNSNIYLFDKDRLQGSRIQIKNGIVASESAMILLQSKILLCGGSDGYSNQTASAYMIDLQTNSANTLQNMLIPTRSHTLGKAIDSEIYSIGGYSNPQRYLNSVEKYSTNTGNWTMMPSINFPRQDVSVCCANVQYLFCFGGSYTESSNWNFVNMIEQFNTLAESQGWQVFQLYSNNGWTHRVYAGSKQLSQTEILIFGGYDGNYLDDVLSFNFVEKKIANTGVKLRRASSFIQRNISIVDLDNWIYAPGFPKLDIHRYSMAGNVFEFLEEANWINSVK